MKFKLTSFLILIFIYVNTNLFANSKVSIDAMVDNEIITNIDIYKEKEYLKLLNPDLLNLEDSESLSLAKNSLINQLIKKNEILKFLNFEEEHALLNSVISNLYKRLGYADENTFKRALESKKGYSISEIKEKTEIELYWNELIYFKYKNSINIDKEFLIKKIKERKDNYKIQFLLSEIFFSKKKNTSLDEQTKEIKKSIKNKGFSNSANIFSMSESSKFGGNIGWIDSNNLSKSILQELNKINKGQYTKVINVGNNFLILKIEDKRSTKIEIDEGKQLNEMINFETNRQLNRFSNIYFNKAKINYSIYEK